MSATAAALQGRSYDDVQVGEQLPELAVPLTRTLIIATALATRDFQDVHHDPTLAAERGSRDIFMNILTSNGLVGRYVTDWAGPQVFLRRVNIRLGAPNYPGDTMTMSGEVVSKQDGAVEVKVVGANSLGNHASGTVTVVFPTGASAVATEGANS
ncbi:MaoC family dehydratase [Rhodococcus sp. X156]|uniref:MaoC family dehydratase n=1 Tax=Rhodococcus sp. X156 TaxID=2499145 RepID=UPI000FDB4A29|nr:MaoC family dehydratase [Rhodococcus sp. X156]